MRSFIKNLIQKKGSGIVRYSPESSETFPDFDQADFHLINKIQQFTLTSPERIFALIRAVEYIASSNIPGDIVECGVWRGGSIMAVASTLLRLGRTNRHLFLYDTFEGMTEPTEHDISFAGAKASDLLRRRINRRRNTTNPICANAPLDQVRESVLSIGYDANKIHFVKGRVEDTIPEISPERVSLLRLDTDWYESTRHELIHLFPRLSTGGVIIIDDYGHWQGAKKAVDEYLKENRISLLLNRIDYTGRIGIKC